LIKFNAKRSVVRMTDILTGTGGSPTTDILTGTRR